MQIVGYEPTGVGPSLLLSSDDTVIEHELVIGDSVSFGLGRRYCGGEVDGSTHIGCQNPRAPFCERHSDTWVCAQCTGTCLKDEMDCFEDHAIYIAAFAPDTFKVGVTKLWRLETRLREQGADRGVHINTVTNGRIARELEAEIADRLPDRVRVQQKIAGLGTTVDMNAWEDIIQKYGSIETFTFDYGFSCSNRPVIETIATGTVAGMKGRILILEQFGTFYAVDMRDLVGYEVEPSAATEDSSTRLQSSFSSFSSSSGDLG